MARWFAHPPWRAPTLLLAGLPAVVLLLRGPNPGPAGPEAPRPGVLSLQVERRTGEDLDRIVARMLARYAAKQQVAAELLDGRITPRQAVRRFREINSSAGVGAALLTDETLLGHVLDHAEYLLRDRPEAAVESALEDIRRQAREGE